MHGFRVIIFFRVVREDEIDEERARQYLVCHRSRLAKRLKDICIIKSSAQLAHTYLSVVGGVGVELYSRLKVQDADAS